MITGITNFISDSESQSPLPELSKQLENELLQVFRLLRDRNRFYILLHLRCEGEMHVTALCERLNQSQPAVSHHLAMMRTTGLVEVRRCGKHNFYSLNESFVRRLFSELSQSVDKWDSDAATELGLGEWFARSPQRDETQSPPVPSGNA